MANILDKYGIKEVADVTFYDIDTKAPVLYLDTLKVSTIEQTAEQAEARGGKGNPPLIIWDYGKEITVTLEDALFSAKSMAIMFGDSDGKVGTSAEIMKTIMWVPASTSDTPPSTFEAAGKKYALQTPKVYDEAGTTVTSYEANKTYFVTGTVNAIDVGEIEISASTFPGTYYVTGDTFARKESNGKDEFFQFIIPKAKVQSENTITLEAEGDPSVFNMSLRVMRPADGKMMKLVKYNLEEVAAG